MHSETSATPNVIVPPPVIFLGALVLGQIIHLIRPTTLLPRFLAPVRWPVGAGLIAAGVAVGFWGSRMMARVGTSIDSSEPPMALVEEGPFQYSRNPLYLSVFAVYLGVNLLRNNRWGVMLLPTLLKSLQIGVIEREEAYLLQRFAEDYRRYTERVPRWL